AADVDEMILLFCHLAQQKGMKGGAKRSGSAFLLTGAGAFIGGLMGGPPGIAVGGTLGGMCGALMSTGPVRPVPQILLELPPAKKKKLCAKAMDILCGFDWSGLSELIALVERNAKLQQKLIALLRDYFSKELGIVIK
ncbi:CS012 protein, partial [Columbina picui]|nr:CS012 protein [Columbina picui]